MNKFGVLFSGQGSQVIGMGQDFYINFDEAKKVYDISSKLLGYDIKKICFEENDLINITQYTQPAIVTTSLAIYNSIINQMNIEISSVLGFSLGEYSALYASGIFDLETIIELVKMRAEYMNEAAIKNKGSMTAIIGLDRKSIENICTKVTEECGIVKIANYNCSTQYVISGQEASVDLVSKIAIERGAVGTVKLNVSGAFHTPLMQYASEKMYNEIIKKNFSYPIIDIYMNCDAKKLENILDLPSKLAKQIISPVYFEDSIINMINDGIDTFIEIGPGTVLRGLVKRINKNVKVFSVNKLEDLSKIQLNN